MSKRSSCKLERAKRLVRHLRRRFSGQVPLRVRFEDRPEVEGIGVHGYFEITRRGNHMLVICSRDSWAVMRDTIVHEFAHHVSVCRGAVLLRRHTNLWGKSFAEVYRCYEEFDKELE